MIPGSLEEVFFDAHEIGWRYSQSAEPMSLPWADVASLAVSAYALPDRVLRIVSLVHQNGAAFEVHEDCVGFAELVDEMCRRFALTEEVKTRIFTLAAGTVFCVRVNG